MAGVTKTATVHPMLRTTSAVAHPMPTLAPSNSPAFDLTGYSTFALAVVTFILAAVAFWQSLLSRQAIVATKTETERGFQFESVHQAHLATPIVIAEASPVKSGQYRMLVLRNVGQGPAVSVRFSGTVAGAEFSAAQYSAAAIGAGGSTVTALKLSKDVEQREPVYELLIRYEDIFGNVYATEYQRLTEESEWYTWKRPWIGKDLGLPKPANHSEEEPAWGFKGRIYYDASKGLY